MTTLTSQKTTTEPYFLQSDQWVTAWLAANTVNHFAYKIEVCDGNVAISGWLLQYPYVFGKSFFLLSKGPIFSDPSNPKSDALLVQFFQKMKELATSHQAVFLKWEPGLESTTHLELHLQPQAWLTQFYPQNQIVFPASRIQFLATIVLDILNVSPESTASIDPTNISQLGLFYEQNSSFWKQRNSNVQRYTKKALQQNWAISTEKTVENFEAFWQVHQQTSVNQGFASYPKSYYLALFQQECSRIIIVSDPENTPQSVWFGVSIGNSLVYLYGGNTEYSKSHFGQYLSHLVAITMAKNEQKHVYDLGGWHAGEGYSKFKENYHGTIVQWSDPVDVIFQPFVYGFVRFLQSIRSLFRKR